MTASNLTSTIITLRHEVGHLVVGKSLGFETGDLQIDEEQAGQSTEIFPSIETLADFIKYAEDRIIVLYAGVLAQNLKNKTADRDAAEKSLVTTAKDDFSKVRELMRPLSAPAGKARMLQTFLPSGPWSRPRPAPWNATAPVREELFGIERLETACGKLGRSAGGHDATAASQISASPVK